jgi:regulator of cell morphogenesis and NO signaling
MRNLELHANTLLEADHERMDTGFDTFMSLARAGTVDRAAIAPAIEAMRRHLWVEEEFFFPPLREAGVTGPVLIALRDHGQLWGLLDELERLLALRNPDPDLLLTIAAAILQVSAHHNEKEEQILFATADQFLDPSIHRRIADGLAMERPAGWVSENARG